MNLQCNDGLRYHSRALMLELLRFKPRLAKPRDQRTLPGEGPEGMETGAHTPEHPEQGRKALLKRTRGDKTRSIDKLKIRPRQRHRKYTKKITMALCDDCEGQGYVKGIMCRRCQGTGHGTTTSCEGRAIKIRDRRERERQRAARKAKIKEKSDDN